MQCTQDAEWIKTLRYKEKNYVGEETDPCNGEDFEVDRNGHVKVYTDGACLRNGQPGATAGIGVWFGENHYL